MSRWSRTWLGVMLSLWAVAGMAEQDDTKPWSDEAELSYVATSGNSEVETLAAKNLFTLKFAEHMQFLWKLAALKGRTDGALTAERYLTDFRLEHRYSERAYTYVNAGWLSDNFAGLDSRVDSGLGGGYRFFIGPKSFLKSEAGFNAVRERYTDSTERRFAEGRLFGEYSYAFSAKNKFTQSVEYLYDFDNSQNYRVNSETALRAALNDHLSLKLSYLIKYDHEPVPPTLEKRDTVLSTAIVANF